MKWAQGFFTVVLLLAAPVTGVSVECENAYTRMERAICGNPRLLEVERQLSTLADEALGNGHIDRAQSLWLRNSLAQDCRRSPEINQCLLIVAKQRIRWLERVTQSVVGTDF